jgi:predicted DNA-binding transcriptional regulator AlpA
MPSRAVSYGSAVELELVGLAEVAEVLRVSRRTAARYARRSDFPEPLARLRAGPVWRKEDVLAWALSEPAARPGKPLKAPRQV